MGILCNKNDEQMYIKKYIINLYRKAYVVIDNKSKIIDEDKRKKSEISKEIDIKSNNIISNNNQNGEFIQKNSKIISISNEDFEKNPPASEDKKNEDELEDILINKEKINIDFEQLLSEIRDTEIEASKTRIETFELKGFNSMEPSNEITKVEEQNVILISNLIDKKNIDMNYMELMKITDKDLQIFDNIHNGKVKVKEIVFDKIILEEIQLNKYGNINLVNCIYMLLNKDKSYFKNCFVKFDLENLKFEYKCYKNGQEKKYLFDHKVIKNTEFIRPDDSNYWIYFIEKSIAKNYKHFINTYNLLASDLYENLSPFSINQYQHIYYDKKKIFKLISENLTNSSNIIIFCEIDPLYISNMDTNKEKIFVSCYINNIFKINGRKYIELFLPYNRDNTANKILLTEEKINTEDLLNKELFPEEKLNNSHYYFLKFEEYIFKFDKFFILNYSKSYFYLNKNFKISDCNINFLKFRVSGEGKIKICLKVNLPRCCLCRFILSKLTITENFIRRIRTMSSEGSEDNEAGSYYEDEMDYDFEYIDSFYEYCLNNKLEVTIENGTYCLLFNVITNNELEMNISLLSYSKEASIEFLDNTLKVSDSKLNIQIKRLFISYLKKNLNNNVIKKRIKDNAFSYTSLYNEKIGYSIFMVENKTDEYNIFVDLKTTNKGMNLITKEYEDDYNSDNILRNEKLVKIIVPPKNEELIIFEWEKSIDNIYINLNTIINPEKIEKIFNNLDLNSYDKKLIENTSVYLIELQYRRGAFLIFVNESYNDEYRIHLSFDNIYNLKYKNFEQDMLEKKEINIKLKKAYYYYLNLKVIKEGEYGYNINLKIQRINEDK